MRATLAALLAATLLTGCVVSNSGAKRPFRPEGETVTVTSAAGFTVTGEFLGVRGADLIVARGGRLIAVPLAGFSKVAIDGYPTVKTAKRGKLLLYARYPQGLNDEQWRQLLRERGQQDFDRLPAP